MGGDVFSYDEAVADSAHGDLQGVISGLESSLSDLGGFVSRVKSNWQGDELDEYAAVQAKWDSASQTVSQILNSVHQALGTTTGSVKDMRGQVRSALRSSSPALQLRIGPERGARCCGEGPPDVSHDQPVCVHRCLERWRGAGRCLIFRLIRSS